MTTPDKFAKTATATVPAKSPNYAPPPAKPLPVPDVGTIYDICGIHNDPATKR